MRQVATDCNITGSPAVPKYDAMMARYGKVKAVEPGASRDVDDLIFHSDHLVLRVPNLSLPPTSPKWYTVLPPHFLIETRPRLEFYEVRIPRNAPCAMWPGFFLPFPQTVPSAAVQQSDPSQYQFNIAGQI